MFKTGLIGIALASVLISPSAAQQKGSHSPTWGAMFKSQVERCWKKPYGGDATAIIEAAFAIKLTRDGLLMEQPVAEKPATSDYAIAYQKSALKALNDCQPYKLPIENYDEWKYFAPVFTEDKTKAGPENKAKSDGKALDGLFNSRTLSICRGC